MTGRKITNTSYKTRMDEAAASWLRCDDLPVFLISCQRHLTHYHVHISHLRILSKLAETVPKSAHSPHRLATPSTRATTDKSVTDKDVDAAVTVWLQHCAEAGGTATKLKSRLLTLTQVLSTRSV
jgi:hypothetical protein